MGLQGCKKTFMYTRMAKDKDKMITVTMKESCMMSEVC